VRRNLITDVAGLKVGEAHDARARTGVSVVLPDKPAVASVSVVGGAPGTRETDLLRPGALVERVDAIVLTGGSVFGLDAASGVAAALARAGRGLELGGIRVPIVPAAVLFDLRNGGTKDWGEKPPYDALGRAALRAASREVALGNAGAGHGARAGRLKGGLGSASHVAEDGLQVGALVAVNSQGGVVVPGTDRFWAALLERDGEFGGRGAAAACDAGEPLPEKTPLPGTSTTIAVVATNARLDKAQCERVAIMAQDGIARAIRPAHTPSDGDTVFALATARWTRPVDPALLARIGALAADCLARAIARGVHEAESLGTMRAYRALYGAPAGLTQSPPVAARPRLQPRRQR
jgi:L-aminopeptidase/D-esterase-like protein